MSAPAADSREALRAALLHGEDLRYRRGAEPEPEVSPATRWANAVERRALRQARVTSDGTAVRVEPNPR